MASTSATPAAGASWPSFGGAKKYLKSSVKGAGS